MNQHTRRARTLIPPPFEGLEEFRSALLGQGPAALARPPLDRLVADFFDRAVKVLDLCHALRDGLDQLRQWRKHLAIAATAPPPGTTGSLFPSSNFGPNSSYPPPSAPATAYPPPPPSCTACPAPPAPPPCYYSHQPPAQGFLLCPDSGGLPADTRLRPLDTLPSAAVTDEKRDVDVTDVAPNMVRFGLVKSSVRLYGCGTGAAIETGATTVKGAGLDGSMARGRGGEGGATRAGGGGGGDWMGPRRKGAWPVRSGISPNSCWCCCCGALETAWSAISSNS
ncbi:hypothetical protein ZWY2020_030541 [Hordeum vulgare]|nr:hypothetical protein ZWY2020_030541 [Hordeum vulgare]